MGAAQPFAEQVSGVGTPAKAAVPGGLDPRLASNP
jgi:hypothetical protein